MKDLEILTEFVFSHRIGPVRCLCCGKLVYPHPEPSPKKERESGCDCEQGTSLCFGCLKCRKHCTCETGPVSFEDTVKGEKANLEQVYG
jgi:hypothetical protein